jgi:outer membrane protein
MSFAVPPHLIGAQQTPAPSQSRDEDTLTWSVGAGFIASPRPYVGTKPRYFAIPAITMQYKRFFFHGIRGGYDFVQSERLTARVLAQVRFRDLDPAESDFLQGMDPRGGSADAGLEVLFRGRPVGFRVNFLTDILGRDNGQEASFLAVTGAPLGRVLLLVGFGPRWESARRVDYYYGVTEEEARPGRPFFRGEATWSWDLNLTAIYDISSKWNLMALLNREGLGSNIRESPLVERDSAYTLLISVTRSF